MQSNNNTTLKYKNLYVLGDSLSDTGAFIGLLNNLPFMRGIKFDNSHYKNTYSSNGPLAVEYLAKHLGLEELEPAFKYTIFYKEHERKGQNYAVSHATASEMQVPPLYHYFFNKFSLKSQLNSLLQQHQDIDAQDLLVIMIGSNDILVNCRFNNEYKESMTKKAAQEINNALEVLINSNAKHIIVSNIPDLTAAPIFHEKSSEEKKCITKHMEDLNTAIEESIEDVKNRYTEADVKLLDLYSQLPKVIELYKDLNYTDACLSYVTNIKDGGYIQYIKNLIKILFTRELVSTYSSNCNKEQVDNNWLFFDSLHVTTLMHKEIGHEMHELALV